MRVALLALLISTQGAQAGEFKQKCIRFLDAVIGKSRIPGLRSLTARPLSAEREALLLSLVQAMQAEPKPFVSVRFQGRGKFEFSQGRVVGVAVGTDRDYHVFLEDGGGTTQHVPFSKVRGQVVVDARDVTKRLIAARESRQAVALYLGKSEVFVLGRIEAIRPIVDGQGLSVELRTDSGAVREITPGDDPRWESMQVFEPHAAELDGRGRELLAFFEQALREKRVIEFMTEGVGPWSFFANVVRVDVALDGSRRVLVQADDGDHVLNLSDPWILKNARVSFANPSQTTRR